MQSQTKNVNTQMTGAVTIISKHFKTKLIVSKR